MILGDGFLDDAWPCSTRNMCRIDAGDQRRGFRHELASTLGLFGVLQRHEPQHPALLGPWRDWFDAMGESGMAGRRAGDADPAGPTAIEREILDLGADEFDLLAWLVCAHHGKVRMAWHSSPADQEANDHGLRIRGVREGDVLPAAPLADPGGEYHQLPATALDLSPSEAGLSSRTGRSWTERALNLVERFGPFTLAWLEALLRAADQRASKEEVTDPLLQERENGNVGHSLDGGDRTLAQPAGGRTPPPASGGDSPPRRQLHGDGGRAGGRGLDPGATRPPHSATRYVEASLGILSYRELAPLLAERVADTELAISDRTSADLPVHDLLLDLHRRICMDLTPDVAGRWRLRDVRVGEHEAPPHWRVPMPMRSYAADLEARMGSVGDGSGDRLLDDLVFAEGRLLHIQDFNGRVSRLFLVELLYRLDLPVIDPAASSAEEAESSILDDLVQCLNYLGRSEGWVEGRGMGEGEPVPEPNCFPERSSGMPGHGWEQITLLAPIDASGLSAWRAERLHEALAGLPLPAGRKPSKALLRKRARAAEPCPDDLLGTSRTGLGPLRVVLARDMRLTGFDAPILHTVYADEPMRGHGPTHGNIVLIG